MMPVAILAQGKKFCHSVISGADLTAQPFGVAIVAPVIH